MLYVIWLLALLCIGIGLLGTVFPALPGTPLIFAGAFLIAWWHDYSLVGVPTLIILGVLAVIGIAVDFIASSLGARKVGASSMAILGATLGSIFGLFFSLPGIILGPFIGAFLGELYVQTSVSQATKVGLGTWIGLLVGTVIKVAVAFSMVGALGIALLV